MYPEEQYGLSREEWIKEKSRRLHQYFNECYERGEPIDIQTLTYQVYRERLEGVSKIDWEPFGGRFQDLRPSPFIRNFLVFLFSKLRENGFIGIELKVPEYRWFEAELILFLNKLKLDGFLERLEIKQLPPYEWFKQLYNDFFTQLERDGFIGGLGYDIPPNDWLLGWLVSFIERLFAEGYLEETGFKEPPYAWLADEYSRFIKTALQDRLLSLKVKQPPTLEWLEDICTWKNDTLQK